MLAHTLCLFTIATPATPLPLQEEPPANIVTPDDARLHGLESLRTIVQQEGVPLPADLASFVRNTNAARALGKALFFDMAIGSDGIQACASCHFHAGADSRTRNQVNPDLKRVENDREGDIIGFFEADPAPDETFQTKGPNQVLTRNDFPFVRDIGEGDNVVEIGDVIEPAPLNSNDVASSQGVQLTDFIAVVPGAAVDLGSARFDPVFNRGGRTLRRVEPRNTPTVINAVFNFHNFWDGRADHFFNGVDPFGQRSLDARIFSTADDLPAEETEDLGGGIWAHRIALNNGSLASQAVGPPLSDFEMSFAGRTFPAIGRKVATRRALATQQVASTDSLLGNLRHPSGLGLNRNYTQLIRGAFHRSLWEPNADHIFFPPDGGPAVAVEPGTTDPDRTFTLQEANFSLFFGLAVMLYEATLVSDDTPFDRWMMGNGRFISGFGPRELAGLNVFVGRAACVNCHGGPELTNASVRNAQEGANLIEPMFMGDGEPAIYDNGFYNISVTPTVEDLGRGGADAFGNPLGSSRALLFEVEDIADIPFPIIGEPIRDLVEIDGVLFAIDVDTGEMIAVCEDEDGDGRCGVEDNFILQRAAVDGAMKTPGLRNRLFMGPYFHNGGAATLREVVEFYNRGGNFCRLNAADLDPDIQQLALTIQERVSLIDFLIALTDPRVEFRQAPFDGPQLSVPNGHFNNGATRLLVISASGAEGVGPDEALLPFLNANPYLANPVIGDTDDLGRVRCSLNADPQE